MPSFATQPARYSLPINNYPRMKFLDPTTGRFTSLDPFGGDSHDPQSFNKYGYVHGDPIQGIDPTGKFLGTAIGVIGGIGMALGVNAMKSSRDLGTGALALRTLIGFAGGYALGGIVAGVWFWDPITQAFRNTGKQWFSSNADEAEPGKEIVAWSTDKGMVDLYRRNIEHYLVQTATEGGGTTADIEAARKIAKAYADNIASQPGSGGWMQSATLSGPNCNQYCTAAAGALRQFTSGTNWTLMEHYDVTKYGQGQHTFFNPMGPVMSGVGWPTDWTNSLVPLHSFISLSFKASENQAKWSYPDWILDPWVDGRPQIYEARQFGKVWPVKEGHDGSGIRTISGF